MSAKLLWCSAARRSCSSCLLSRSTSAYYSQSVSGPIRDPEVSVPAITGTKTLAGAQDNSHQAVACARGPLDLTRLDRYLASIKAADLQPTLEDIEKCKPGSFSRPDSTRYAVEYTNLLETLCRCFSKDQLRHFTELYKLNPIWTRSSRRKTEYAESIIEKAWGWPSLKEIERKRRDTTEVLAKSFTVTPSQLFLIMGTDGTDLLQLSTQYNVHISLTSDPLALRVEGLRGSLKGMTEHVSNLKKGIIDEIFELPTGRPVRSDLLQRISRLAGAYVENHGHKGKVRICAKHRNDIIAAKQLALRASLEVGAQAHTVCFDPPSNVRNSPVEVTEPRRYSVYPFVAPLSFPWTMHSGGTFRVRQVTDWLGTESCEDITSTGGLAGNQHRLLNLGQCEIKLQQLIGSTMSEGSSHSRRSITASLGHILISSGGNSQRTSIFPPLKGTLSLLGVLNWVETSGMSLAFVPSAPPAMTTASVGKRRDLHRLVYKTLPPVAGHVSNPPQHVLKFEMEFPGPLFASTQTTQDFENAPGFKDTFNRSDPSTNALSPQTSSGSLPDVVANEKVPNYQVGRETYVNLMFPSRPMDMQLSIFEWDDVSMQLPQALREYAKRFRYLLINGDQPLQPEPPSTLSHEGQIYYLYDNLSLRGSNNSNLLSTAPNDCNADNSVEVCRENITDLQSAQKMEVCQVKFDGSTDGPSWSRFLAACDQLGVQSQGKDKARPAGLS